MTLEKWDPCYLNSNQSFYLLKTRGPNFKLFRRNGKLYFGHFFIKLVYLWNSCKFIILNPQFFGNAFYLTVSILALNYSWIFYSFQLFEIMV